MCPFQDSGEETNERHSFVPLVEEPFIFFYSEDKAGVEKRFESWFEKTLVVFLRELKKNL